MPALSAVCLLHEHQQSKRAVGRACVVAFGIIEEPLTLFGVGTHPCLEAVVLEILVVEV